MGLGFQLHDASCTLDVYIMDVGVGLEGGGRGEMEVGAMGDRGLRAVWRNNKK